MAAMPAASCYRLFPLVIFTQGTFTFKAANDSMILLGLQQERLLSFLQHGNPLQMLDTANFEVL